MPLANCEGPVPVSLLVLGEMLEPRGLESMVPWGLARVGGQLRYFVFSANILGVGNRQMTWSKITKAVKQLYPKPNSKASGI